MALQRQLGGKRDCPNICQFPFGILSPQRGSSYQVLLVILKICSVKHWATSKGHGNEVEKQCTLQRDGLIKFWNSIKMKDRRRKIFWSEACLLAPDFRTLTAQQLTKSTIAWAPPCVQQHIQKYLSTFFTPETMELKCQKWHFALEKIPALQEIHPSNSTLN